MATKLCQRCINQPATKRHVTGPFYYCDQCVWELGVREVVAIDRHGHDVERSVVRRIRP